MISRRELLAGAVAAPVPLLLAAAAQPKLSRQEAKYQDRPKGQQRCEICLNFQPPQSCRFVEGPISPTGWCQMFAARENAH